MRLGVRWCIGESYWRNSFHNLYINNGSWWMVTLAKLQGKKLYWNKKKLGFCTRGQCEGKPSKGTVTCERHRLLHNEESRRNTYRL